MCAQHLTVYSLHTTVYEPCTYREQVHHTFQSSFQLQSCFLPGALWLSCEKPLDSQTDPWSLLPQSFFSQARLHIEDSGISCFSWVYSPKSPTWPCFCPGWKSLYWESTGILSTPSRVRPLHKLSCSCSVFPESSQVSNINLKDRLNLLSISHGAL